MSLWPKQINVKSRYSTNKTSPVMNLCGVVKILLLYRQNFKLQVTSTTIPKCIVWPLSDNTYIPQFWTAQTRVFEQMSYQQLTKQNTQ